MDRVITTTLYLTDDEKELIVGRERGAPPAEVTFAWVPQLDPNNIPGISNALGLKPDKIQVSLAEFLDAILRTGCYSPSACLSRPRRKIFPSSRKFCVSQSSSSARRPRRFRSATY